MRSSRRSAKAGCEHARGLNEEQHGCTQDGCPERPGRSMTRPTTRTTMRRSARLCIPASRRSPRSTTYPSGALARSSLEIAMKSRMAGYVAVRRERPSSARGSSASSIACVDDVEELIRRGEQVDRRRDDGGRRQDQLRSRTTSRVKRQRTPVRNSRPAIEYDGFRATDPRHGGIAMDAITPKAQTADQHSHVVRPAEMEWQKTRFPGCVAKTPAVRQGNRPRDRADAVGAGRRAARPRARQDRADLRARGQAGGPRGAGRRPRGQGRANSSGARRAAATSPGARKAA